MNVKLPKTGLKKNDLVQVIAGKEKSKTGKVIGINAKTMRVTVEKLNLVSKHVKPSQKNPNGGIIEKELPISVSNVLLFCGKCKRGVRHGIKLEKKGTSKEVKKTRICKRCSSSLDAV